MAGRGRAGETARTIGAEAVTQIFPRQATAAEDEQNAKALETYILRQLTAEALEMEIWERIRVRNELLRMPITILSRRVLLAHLTEWWRVVRISLARRIAGGGL